MATIGAGSRTQSVREGESVTITKITEDHADGVEVVGGAGHQFAGTITHVEFGLEDQQTFEEIVANVEFDVAGDADERPARGEGEKALDRDA